MAGKQQDGVGHACHRALGFEYRSGHFVATPAVGDAEKEQPVFRVCEAEPRDAVLLDCAFDVPHDCLVVV